MYFAKVIRNSHGVGPAVGPIKDKKVTLMLMVSRVISYSLLHPNSYMLIPNIAMTQQISLSKEENFYCHGGGVTPNGTKCLRALLVLKSPQSAE